MVTAVDQLQSHAEIERFVLEGYRASGSPRSKWARMGPPLEFGFEWGKLPLAVAEPGPLIEQAVKLAGPSGMTLQEIRILLKGLGAERLDRGLRFAREGGNLLEVEETRADRAGRQRKQVVLRVAN